MDSCLIRKGLRLINEEDEQHVLLCLEGEETPDRLALTMMARNTSPYFAPLETTEQNGVFRYTVPGKRFHAIDEPWNRKRLANFFGNLASALEEAEDYLLDPAMLVLHPQAIAVTEEKVVFLVLPIHVSASLNEALSSFCRTALFSRPFAEEESRSLSLVFNALRSPAFDRKELVALSDRLQNDLTGRSTHSVPSKIVSSDLSKRNAPIKEENASPEHAPFLVPPQNKIPIDTEDTEKESGQKAEAAQPSNHPDWKTLSGYAEKRDPFSTTEPLVLPAREMTEKGDSKKDEKKDSPSERVPTTLLELLMHFSVENWKRYRSAKEKKTKAAKPLFQKTKQETTPLLWEENGHIRMIHIPDNACPRLRFSEKEEVKLSTLPMMLGRERGADIVRTSRKVSGKHARFSLDDGRYTITDWQSSNGTYVNNSRLVPHVPQTISQGDRLRFGDEEAIFLL